MENKRIVRPWQAAWMLLVGIAVIIAGLLVMKLNNRIVLTLDGVIMCLMAWCFGIPYAELQQDIRSEQMRLTAAQNATAAYVGKLKELYQHEMDYLNGLSKLSAPAEPVVDQVASAAQDISQSVEKLVAGEAPEEDAEDTVDLGGGAKEKDGGLYAELLELSRSHSPEEAEEPTEPTRRIDFDHLQFGKDYEIK